jgi:hypothetical protein
MPIHSEAQFAFCGDATVALQPDEKRKPPPRWSDGAADRRPVMDLGSKIYRIIASVMAVAAIVWGMVVVWQATQREYDPPIGALCAAIPAIGLLIGARVVWSRTSRRNDPHDSM